MRSVTADHSRSHLDSPLVACVVWEPRYYIFKLYLYTKTSKMDAKVMLHLAGETLNKFFFTMMVCVVFTVVLESPADEDEPKTFTKAKTMYRSCMDVCKCYYTHTHIFI